jgi:hypothetical protein
VAKCVEVDFGKLKSTCPAFQQFSRALRAFLFVMTGGHQNVTTVSCGSFTNGGVSIRLKKLRLL